MSNPSHTEAERKKKKTMFRAKRMGGSHPGGKGQPFGGHKAPPFNSRKAGSK